MIHANRVVTVGDQESIINKPIVLYRGDREVEIEFELVGNEFMFTTEGNVIKSVNASHGQLVLNTPSGDNMFSTLVECHDGKVIFIITKEMIDELVEVGFYSFQIRLYDSAEMKSRVTIPPVMNGFDIRNPIAAEDEANVVDQGLVDYARICRDQSNEELPTFDWEGNYNKTEWIHHDVITENKMNKIEDAISSITDRMNGSDIVFLKKAKDMEKQHQNDMDELNAKDTQLTNDIQTINRTLTNEIAKMRVDMEAKDTQLTNEINKVAIDNDAIVSTVDGKIAAVEADMEARIESIDGKMLEVESDVSLINDDILLATISEELTNNSVTSFKAGTSNVTGIDLTDQMEQSIVSLDNIEGKTEVVENITDPTQKLNNTRIKLLYTLDENDQVNYFNNDNLEMGVFDDRINYQHSASPSETIRIHSDVAIQDSYLLVEVTGLTPGEVYCLTVGNIVVYNGVSAIAIYDNMKHNVLSNAIVYHSEDPTQSDNGLVVKAGSDRLGFIFYSNTVLDVAGDVTYQNISLRKVKEYSPMDITLRSLPNGIKDEIKDGKLIKRVGSYNLKGTEDWFKVDIRAYERVVYACELPNTMPANVNDIAVLANTYDTVSYYELYHTDGLIGFALGGDLGGSNNRYLMYSVSPDFDTEEKIKTHISTVEKDIIIEYPIQPEVYDIDLSIVCDPDDIVYISTNRNISCSHQVQLSTKSQVEEAQKQIAKSNKSIWRKFKELTEKIKNLTDAEMKLENNGYIKLPTAFGGLIIQWGLECLTANGVARDVTKVVEYPIDFTQRVFFSHSNCYNSSWLTTGCTGEGLTSMTLCVVNLDGNPLPQADFWVTWFAVGK